MKTFVIVEDGVVVNRAVGLTELAGNWIESDVAQVGWLFDGEQLTPPPAPAVNWLPVIAARRYQLETAGITIPPGIPIDTGRDSQALITGAVVAAIVDPSYVCRWKTGAGFVDLTAAQLIAIATAVRTHVQACFDREDELLAAVSDSSFVESMLDEGWP